MSAPQGEPRPRAELPPELRRAIVYLFLVAAVAAVLAGGGVFYALARSNAENRAAITADDHKFCAVVEAATAAPVRKPPDPAATPGRESTYKFYVAFLALGRSLGCD